MSSSQPVAARLPPASDASWSQITSPSPSRMDENPQLPGEFGSPSEMSVMMHQEQVRNQLKRPFIWLRFERSLYGEKIKMNHLNVMKTCSLESEVSNVRDMVNSYIKEKNVRAGLGELWFRDLNMMNSPEAPLSAFGVDVLSPSLAARTILVSLKSDEGGYG
mmetsp:Transcript_16581/g.28108  ORF Transcript_16581/g.28108 Transcript_16581/m.28108 type:complete len:162 (+) Transcript_16581:59-544(+)